MEITRKRKCMKSRLQLMTTVFLAFAIAVLMGARAAEVESSSAGSYEELLNQMRDAEYVIYQEAEQTALQVRLQVYQYYMDQELDAPLVVSTPQLKMVHRIAELYGDLLMLRIETIIEAKRRWPDHSLAEQIDMLT